MSSEHSQIQGMASLSGVANKLFREAGRLLSSETEEDAADNFINFIITNSALRDWYLAGKGEAKGSVAFSSWRSGAEGYFGICADLCNHSKHNTYHAAVATSAISEKTQAISANGPILKYRMQFSVKLFKNDEELADSYILVSKICSAWIELLSADISESELCASLAYKLPEL